MDTPDLGKMIGPLPLGAWIGAVGGSLGLAWWMRKNKAAGAAATVPGEVLASAPLNQYLAPDGALPLNGTTGTTTTVPAPTIPGRQYESNGAWGNAALQEMIVRGYGPLLVNSALAHYLNGTALSTAEAGVVEIVLRLLGPPPYGVPPPVALPPPTVTTPTAAPTVAPVPAARASTYIVKAGDTLASIGRAVGLPWQNIAQANHLFGGTSLNLKPGQTLVIP